MNVRLPPTLHGFDTATVMIRGALALTDIEPSVASSLSKCKVQVRTSHGRSVITEKQKSDEDESVIEFNNRKLALPVKRRFSSPLIVAFTDSLLSVKQRKVAEAVIWLMDIPDRSRTRIHIPGKSPEDGKVYGCSDIPLLSVYRTKDFSRLEQNYWTPYNFDEESSSSTESHHPKYNTSDSHNETIRRARDKVEERGLERIATLSIDLSVEPGLSSAHRSLTKKEPRQRVVMEGFDWAIMSGLRRDPAESQGNSDEDSDIGTEHSQPREQEAQRLEYFGEDDTNEQEDGQSTLDEYLASRRTFDPEDDHEPSYIPVAGSTDTTEVGSGGFSSQAGYTNSQQNGRKRSMESASDDGAEKGWKQKYQEWKSKQVSMSVRQCEVGSNTHRSPQHPSIICISDSGE